METTIHVSNCEVKLTGQRAIDWKETQAFINERLAHYKGKPDEAKRVERLKARFPLFDFNN